MTAISKEQAMAPRVLMVDDQEMVCEAVRQMLAEETGAAFCAVTDPADAIPQALEFEPTVILQDLIMPDIDGLTLVRFIRDTPELADVPLIVLSSREEAETKKNAFELGANDYMVKFPDKLEVLARLRYHSMSFTNLLERNAAQAALQAELDEAARYVRSLFPDELTETSFATAWKFIASSDLAGDSFGYHWIDSEHFAIYLLDVCGHGVGAALHSVSALNVIRAQNLRETDFRDPGAVLAELNNAFDMDKYNQMYFTMWYGVYEPATKRLRYASGGHPPAVRVRASAGWESLGTRGIVIGGMPGFGFDSAEVVLEPGDRLYVFSDGVYEVDRADGSGMLTEGEFSDKLYEVREMPDRVGAMVDWVRGVQGRERFEDDFSLLEFSVR